MAKMCGKGMEREEPQNPGSRPLEWAAAVETEAGAQGQAAASIHRTWQLTSPGTSRQGPPRDEAEVLDREKTSECGQGRGKRGEGIPV